MRRELQEWFVESEEPAAVRVGVECVNYQMLRRTCATWMQKSGSVKDGQAQLRHASPMLSAAVYMQVIPESVGEALGGVEAAWEG